MDTKTFLENLEALHKEWQGRLGTTYTKDGVVYHNEETEEQTIQKWFESDKRIVFLLKDQNQGEEKDRSDDDLRYWLKDKLDDTADTIANIKERNRNLKPPKINGKQKRTTILLPIAYIFFGLMNIDKEHGWTYYDVTAYRKLVQKTFNTQPFAFVECKKEPGSSSVSGTTVISHLKQYREHLQKELKILNPNIIVCMDKPGNIFNLVKPIMFPNSAKQIESGNEWCYNIETDTLMLNSYHPSYFNADKYEYAMRNYRAFLQWKENNK